MATTMAGVGVTESVENGAGNDAGTTTTIMTIQIDEEDVGEATGDRRRTRTRSRSRTGSRTTSETQGDDTGTGTDHARRETNVEKRLPPTAARVRLSPSTTPNIAGNVDMPLPAATAPQNQTTFDIVLATSMSTTALESVTDDGLALPTHTAHPRRTLSRHVPSRCRTAPPAIRMATRWIARLSFAAS